MLPRFRCLVFCSCLAACGSSGETGAGGSGGLAANGGGAAAGGAGNAMGGTPTSGGSGTGGGSAAGASTGGAGAVIGAFSVNIQTASGCSVATQAQDFPVVSGRHPVTAADRGGGIANKTVDASGYPANVYCSWFSDKAPYMIDAGLMLGAPGSGRTVEMNSTLVIGSSSTGGMVLHAKELPDLDYAGQCSFTVIQLDPATRSVWGSFTCASLDKFASDGATQVPTQCTVGPSYFYFQNCTKP